jgi:2-polyprenyl-3-methyl-5-hydroxy-6-metoxy-1,4-benzoquinol methylase
METTILQSNICPLCKNKALPYMGKQKNYWYCDNCSLGWIKHIPKVAYKEEYYQSGSSLLGKLYKPVENTFYKIRNSYGGNSRKLLWIDVGAGDGNYLEKVYAKKRIGVEISASGRKTMKEKGLAVLTNGEFLTAKNLQADVISFWQVIEHVRKPKEYIRAAEKNLKNSGKLIIAVPNISSWEYHFFDRYWFHLAPLYHIWHFSPKSMTMLLQNHNLKIDSIDYFAVEHHLTGTLQTFINKTTRSEDILHKLIKRRQNLESLTMHQKILIAFWCTLGLPIIVLFWTIASITKRSGTFVIVASKKKTTASK